MPAPNPYQPAEDRTRAILFMACTVLLFGALDCTAKYLSTRLHFPTAQVVWLRFLMQMLLTIGFAPLLGVRRRGDLIIANKPAMQLVRSVLMLTTTFFNFMALRYLRLDQTVTISFVTPLVVALLAGPLLGEWIGWRRLIAVLVGFAGILVAVRPGMATVPPAVLYSVLSMLAYALFLIATRWLAPYDPPMRTLFYSMLAGATVLAPFAIAEWRMPSAPLECALLLSTGVTGGVSHYLLILAHRLAPATAIAPFIYLQLISMVFFGYVVFSDVPDVFTLFGASIVIASGVYLWDRERRVKALARARLAAVAS